MVSFNLGELQKIRKATSGFFKKRARTAIANALLELRPKVEHLKSLEGPERQLFLEKLVDEATANRHAALAAGATNRGDYRWAAPAACESWLHALALESSESNSEVEALIYELMHRVSNYMPQDVFNMCAVTAAYYDNVDGLTVEDFAKTISDGYRNDYIDDGFEEDIISASYNILKFIDSNLSKEKAPSVLHQLQFCIKKFHPNGKKKRLFLNGQLFNRQKRSSSSSRLRKCLVSVLKYHLGTVSGKFPVAPKDFSL